MADKLDWNHWRKLMRKHLGKSLHNHYNSFILDIILICIDLKPSLLFDYAFIDVEKVVKVIEELHSSGAIPGPLKVIVVEEDLFIVDLEKLLIILKENLKKSCFSLVDVSGSLEKPKFLDTETENKIYQHFKDLLFQLEKLSLESTFRLDIEVKQEWNISTMFGFLLCYPVIYWFNDTFDYNCLSLVPLALHKATLNIPLIINHKSFPQFNDLVNSAPLLSSSKMFFSFSCPNELVNSTIITNIDKWTERLRKTSSTVCPDMKLQIEKTVVVEKQVTL